MSDKRKKSSEYDPLLSVLMLVIGCRGHGPNDHENKAEQSGDN